MNSQSPFKHSKKSAFTLIEILVVVAIIGVLAILAIPSVTKAVAAGEGAKCISNLRQSGAAMVAYASDNNGTIVLIQQGSSAFSWGTTLFLNGYLTDPGVMICPSAKPDRIDRDQFAVSPGVLTIYGASLDNALDRYTTGGSSGSIVRLLRSNVIDKPSEYILLGDSILGTPGSRALGNMQRYVIRREAAGSSGYFSLRHGNRGNVLMADGSCKAVDATEYGRLRREMYALTGAANASNAPVEVFDQLGNSAKAP
jgi:prepilin-type N-terminal cleavage/methylation domain-containing protein/prepilin-type processing-associated H-X9-DG protein